MKELVHRKHYETLYLAFVVKTQEETKWIKFTTCHNVNLPNKCDNNESDIYIHTCMCVCVYIPFVH